jgi:DNA-binding transcriptional regulator YiaG
MLLSEQPATPIGHAPPLSRLHDLRGSDQGDLLTSITLAPPRWRAHPLLSWLFSALGSVELLTRATPTPPSLRDHLPLGWLIDTEATGSLVVKEERAAAPQLDPEVAVPATEQIALVNRLLGLGKSQLARIFNVSRQTIYDWLKGRCEPMGDNATNLAILARALRATCGDATRPLYHRFVTDSSTSGEASVLELLEATPWREDDLRTALRHARRLTDERHRRLGQDQVGGVSSTQGDSNLLDNSIANGLE